MNLLAQVTSPGAKPVKTGNEWRMPSDAIARSQQFADELIKPLHLDEIIAKKVFTAYLANTKSVDEIRMGSGSEKDKKAALQTNQAAFERILKGILSPVQFDGYLKLETGKDKNRK